MWCPRQDPTIQGPGPLTQRTPILQKVALEELPCPTGWPAFHVAPNTSNLGDNVTRGGQRTPSGRAGRVNNGDHARRARHSH